MIFQYILERIRAAFAEEPKPYRRPQPLHNNWCVENSGKRRVNYIWEKR